jgi:hypothetical protein
MIRQHFLSEENRDVVFQILEREISKKDGIQISNYPKLQIPQRLQGLMKDMIGRVKPDELNGNPEQQLTQLNKKVLLVSIPGFSKMISENKASRQETDPLLKRNQILDRGNVNRVDHRPMVSARRKYESDNESNKESVNKKFSDLEASRRQEFEARPSDQPDFTDKGDNDNYEDPNKLFERLENERKNELHTHEKTSQDKKIHNQQNFHPSQTVNTDPREVSYNVSAKSSSDLPDDGLGENLPLTAPTERLDGMLQFERQQEEQKKREDAFNDRLTQLQAKREQTFKQNLAGNEATRQPAPPYPQPKISESRDPQSQPSSIYLERNRVVQPVDLAKTDPKSLLQLPLSSETTAQAVYPKAQIQVNHNIGRVPPKAPEIKNENQYTIVVNASDRKWYGDWTENEDGSCNLSPIPFPNRYSFPLKFDPSNGEQGQVSIKRNFRNITQIELVDVILSAHDNPTYVGRYGSETIGAGMILVEPNETENNGEQESEKQEIEEESVTEELITPYLHMNLQNLPYLSFSLREFSGSVYSTNTINRTSIARMIVAKQYLQSNNRKEDRTMSGFVLLTPHNGNDLNGVLFRPTPLPSLDMITIGIERPDGELYASENPWNLDHCTVQAMAVVEEGQEDAHIDCCGQEHKFIDASESETDAEPDQAEYKEPSDCHLEVFVDPPFHPTLFKEGDQLLFKSVEFLHKREGCESILKNRSPQQELIRNYLTSPHGVYAIGSRYCKHFIHSRPSCAEEKIALGFCNVIMLSLPFTINSKGQFKQYKYQCQRWLAGGNVLNKSIQPVVTLSLKTQSLELSRSDLRIDSTQDTTDQ